MERSTTNSEKEDEKKNLHGHKLVVRWLDGCAHVTWNKNWLIMWKEWDQAGKIKKKSQ